MKIYISEKEDLYSMCENYSNEGGLAIVASRSAYPITNAKIQSIEQYEAEIRKPLEEEIKKIKSTRMPASIPDGVALHYKQENAVINKAKQEVINELLNWAKKEDNYHSKFDYGAQEVMHRVSQKLNEMKGE